MNFTKEMKHFSDSFNEKHLTKKKQLTKKQKN